MDNNTARVVVSQLVKLKDIDREVIVNLLLQYLGNGYELEKIITDLLAIDNKTTVRGL